MKNSFEWDDLLVGFNKNPPALLETVAQIDSATGLNLPRDYIEFLYMSDGGEGFIGKFYLILWSVSELLELNEGYKSVKFSEKIFLFGSDGGGEAFAFNFDTQPIQILTVPFIDMSEVNARYIATDMKGFFRYLYSSSI